MTELIHGSEGDQANRNIKEAAFFQHISVLLLAIDSILFPSERREVEHLLEVEVPTSPVPPNRIKWILDRVKDQPLEQKIKVLLALIAWVKSHYEYLMDNLEQKHPEFKTLVEGNKVKVRVTSFPGLLPATAASGVKGLVVAGGTKVPAAAELGLIDAPKVTFDLQEPPSRGVLDYIPGIYRSLPTRATVTVTGYKTLMENLPRPGVCARKNTFAHAHCPNEELVLYKINKREVLVVTEVEMDLQKAGSPLLSNKETDTLERILMSDTLIKAVAAESASSPRAAEETVNAIKGNRADILKGKHHQKMRWNPFSTWSDEPPSSEDQNPFEESRQANFRRKVKELLDSMPGDQRLFIRFLNWHCSTSESWFCSVVKNSLPLLGKLAAYYSDGTLDPQLTEEIIKDYATTLQRTDVYKTYAKLLVVAGVSGYGMQWVWTKWENWMERRERRELIEALRRSSHSAARKGSSSVARRSSRTAARKGPSSVARRSTRKPHPSPSRSATRKPRSSVARKPRSSVSRRSQRRRSVSRV